MAARKKKPPSAPSKARAGKATASAAKSTKKPAKKRASLPQLSPQQRGAQTRAANRAAEAAAHLKRQEAAAKAAETRRETARLVEKGQRAKLTNDEFAFLEERSKKCRSQAVCASIYAALAYQEDRKTTTQKIKETLVSLRREAIKNKVGWYPSKLVHSTFVTETRPRPGSTWREQRTSPMYVEQEDGTRKLDNVTFE
jgi:hypothetical protein